jgi:hypothetical protein
VRWIKGSLVIFSGILQNFSVDVFHVEHFQQWAGGVKARRWRSGSANGTLPARQTERCRLGQRGTQDAN